MSLGQADVPQDRTGVLRVRGHIVIMSQQESERLHPSVCHECTGVTAAADNSFQFQDSLKLRDLDTEMLSTVLVSVWEECVMTEAEIHEQSVKLAQAIREQCFLCPVGIMLIQFHRHQSQQN